jgi:hypothetical protein
MSRHEIPARDPDKHQVTVGWDHPLQTYFVQVYLVTEPDDDKKLFHWRGTNLRELYEIDDLRRALGRYAELTAQMGSTLYGDKDEGR